MHYSLIIQYPYESIDIALCENGLIIDSISLHKFDAISKTIPTMIQFLSSRSLNLSDISFLAANIGPGPYNTLRAILTMLNGIHTVNNIPLISLNALDLISEEIKEKNYLVVLNAFENHIFYKMQNSSEISYGANSVTEVITIINAQKDSLVIHGNSAIKYQKEFTSSKKIIYPEQISLFNKLNTLAASSYTQFTQNKFFSGYLKPIYFEDLAAHK